MFQRVCTAFALLLCLAAAGLAQAKTEPAPAASKTASLYKRLGGYDAIAAVMDDFLAQMAQDKQLSRFLVGLSDSSKGRLRQLAVEQLCQAAGGPCVYVGRDTKTAHKGLGITGSDWDLAVKALVASLDKFKVPVTEKTELLGLVSSLKPDIVEKP
jgi:hemoglobin